MLAIRFAVQNAFTPTQVVQNLAAFVDHLRRYRIEAILPERLANLSARDADDIRNWAQRLRENPHDRYCLTAAGQLWFEEIREAYSAACRRLDDLEAGGAGSFGETKSQQVPVQASLGA
jgi:hypothetical protein